jgi:hypothetical protein
VRGFGVHQQRGDRWRGWDRGHQRERGDERYFEQRLRVSRYRKLGDGRGVERRDVVVDELGQPDEQHVVERREHRLEREQHVERRQLEREHRELDVFDQLDQLEQRANERQQLLELQWLHE